MSSFILLSGHVHCCEHGYLHVDRSKAKTVKYFSILITMLFAAQAVGGQEEKKIPVLLKLSIPSLGDETTFPSLRLSAERKLGVKTSLAIEAGYQLYAIDRFVDTANTKPKGIKLGAELRYYPGHQSRSNITGFYLAANAFFRRNKYAERLEYYSKTDQNPNYAELTTDEFTVKKSISGLHLLVGKQFNLRVPLNPTKPKKVFPRVFIDGSLGLGCFYRHTVNEHREFNEELFERNRPRHPNVYDAYIRSGLSENSGLRPSLVFNFRIGYRL